MDSEITTSKKAKKPKTITTNAEKDKVIDKVYYDTAGYGSVQATWQEAKVIDPTITLDFVKSWFSGNVQVKKQPGGNNSFVAPHAFYEFQIDLFWLVDLKKQKFKVGCLCIDIFSKYAVVVPIKSKKGPDVAAGILQCFNEMKGKPKILYTDDEGAFDSLYIRKYYTEQDIKHYITRKHANFAERFIRTYKALLYRRIDSVRENNVVDPQWTDYNWAILLVYNTKLIHSSTKMTPVNAAKKENELEAKNNMELRAKHNRKYPPLNVGDKVQIMRKKKNNEKERTSHWSAASFTISDINEQFGQKYYKVEGMVRDYIRGELLKI